MRYRLMVSIGLLLSVALWTGRYQSRSVAQDAPAAPALPAVPIPTELVDQIMALICQGRIDDGIALMEGLKTQPDLRAAARSRLIQLKDQQGAYHGYDIAAVQKFTSQFETLDALAYYDDQPVLFRFHLYRPQNQPATKWIVLGFQTTTAVQDITEILRDTPVDYLGRTQISPKRQS